MPLLLSKYTLPGGRENQWKISGLTHPNLAVPLLLLEIGDPLNSCTKKVGGKTQNVTSLDYLKPKCCFSVKIGNMI